MRLRVAVDGRMLQANPLGGVGRYLAGVLPLLGEHAEVAVVVDGRRALPTVELGRGVEVVALSAPPGVPGLGWLELAVAPWLRRFGGVFHGSFNTLPLTFRGRTVLTLHDLAPQLHPEDFPAITRAAWRVYVRASVAQARAITTVSEFSKRQIVEYFGVSPERVRVAPDALDPLFSPRRAFAAPELARSLGIAAPYVVAVGGARRRALPVAIAAWREARRRLGADLGLAVLGETDLAPEPGLVALGRVDDPTWATVLAGARALCYPTRYEGFGLPALEALASGTPVVCSPVASLPEVLGDAACWASEPSPAALGAQIARLLEDPAFARERRDAGLARARAAGTWSGSAQVLLEAYERAAA
jgi:glycosyltransferase involved in cell wall biosynthesis